MAKKYVIFCKEWNKEYTLEFQTLEEAQKEWDRICSDRHALKSDGGKNVSLSYPELGWESNRYAKRSYQACWIW